MPQITLIYERVHLPNLTYLILRRDAQEPAILFMKWQSFLFLKYQLSSVEMESNVPSTKSFPFFLASLGVFVLLFALEIYAFSGDFTKFSQSQ